MILAENDLSKYVHSDYIKTEKDDFEESVEWSFYKSGVKTIILMFQRAAKTDGLTVLKVY